MSSFPAIRVSSLRRSVAEVLRSALLEGRFQPGAELSDSLLATEFSVSRGPVREALMLLAEEGLVEHQHNRGFLVPRLTRQDLVQISQARRPLEVLALELARPRMGEAEIRHLIKLKNDLLDAFRSGGIKVCATPDLAFHTAVWEYSGNTWLHAALRRIGVPYFAYVSAFNLGRRDHSVELMEAMHQRYIDFLAGQSQESTDECVLFHLGLSDEQ